MLLGAQGLLLATALAGGHCLEDAAALVQRGLRPASGLSADPHVDLLGTLFSVGRGKFNCTRWPKMCQEPLNCQKYNGFKSAKWHATGVAIDGHSNPQALCTNPWSSAYYTKCLVDKDLLGAAELYYNLTSTGEYGNAQHKLEVDGSMCFLEGLCNEDRLHANSTLEDAEAVCDLRYGRERWTLMDSAKADKKDHMFANLGSFQEFEHSLDGLKNRLQSTPFALSACSKGYFHCDVAYCKETYCKKVYYQEKYGRFLQKYKDVEAPPVVQTTPPPDDDLIADLLRDP